MDLIGEFHPPTSRGHRYALTAVNGTEFENKLFKEVVEKLGMEFSIHSPPYRPQSNGKIEGFHRFLRHASASISTMDWNGMNSHQLQQHATTSFQTAT